MQPKIDKTRFGAFTLEGTSYPHDILIRPDGRVKRRKKELSKDLYGTSHIVSLDEAKHILKQEAARLIIGSGVFNRVKLSDEAKQYFESKNCEVKILPTRKVVQFWNELEGGAIGLFHVTC